MPYTTAVEDAEAIRAEYRSHGWSNRDVGVRTRGGSTSSSITVTIKSAGVDAAKAERIARGIAESVARCERTGEILNGGNRYVSVRYSEDCREVLARRHLDALEGALRALPDDPGARTLQPIDGTDERAFVGWDPMVPSRACLWVDGSADAVFDPDTEPGRRDGAFRLAKLLARAED